MNKASRLLSHRRRIYSTSYLVFLSPPGAMSLYTVDCITVQTSIIWYHSESISKLQKAQVLLAPVVTRSVVPLSLVHILANSSTGSPLNIRINFKIANITLSACLPTFKFHSCIIISGSQTRICSPSHLSAVSLASAFSVLQLL